MNTAEPRTESTTKPLTGRRATRAALVARQRVIVPGHRFVVVEKDGRPSLQFERRAMPRLVLGGWNLTLTDAGRSLPRATRRALAGVRRPLRSGEYAALTTFVRAQG